MFTELEKEPMVSVMIHPMPGDTSGVVEVGHNGHFYLLARGRQLEVPRPLAEILRQGGLLG